MAHRRAGLSAQGFVWLAIGSGPVLLLGGPLVSDKVLFWGTPALQFIPWWVEGWRQLQSGTIPLWNSLNGMGAPLLANYQTAFLYPLNWLLFAFAVLKGAAGIAWGYTFLAMLHLIWAGMGMAALLRKSGASPLAQSIAGMAYALSGYLVARLGFFSMIWVAAWIPWVIRYADDIAGPLLPTGIKEKHPVVHLPLVACLAMQLLAGHAQLAWYSFLLVAAWVILGFIKNRQTKPILKALGSLALAGLFAMLIAAVQLIPTAEYLAQSQRSAEVGYQDAVVYSFWPWRFITLFAPDFFGNPGAGNYWGYASYWEDAAYIGVLPILLAISSLGFLLRKGTPGQSSWYNRYLTGFLWVWVGISFLLGLGGNTPVFPFLYAHVPTFALFQAPARFLIWATFGLVLLAAIGIDRWRCPTGKGLYWFRLATAGAFAVTLGAGLAWMSLNTVQLTFIRATALAGLLALGAGVFTLLIPWVDRRGLRRWWTLGVYLWVLSDLLLFGILSNPVVDADIFAASPSVIKQTGEQLNGMRIYLGEREEYALKFKRFLRFNDYTELESWKNLLQVEIPNLNLMYGVPSANNFDPLVPGRYANWIDLLENSSPSVRQAMLATMGVGAVERIDLSQPVGVRLDHTEDGGWYAWFSCATWLKTGNEVLEQVKLSTVENRQLFLEANLNGSGGNCSAEKSSQIELLVNRPDRLDFRITAKERGWFFIANTWYPGWQARIDGQPAPIYRANYLFQALAVEAGIHTITLQYRPETFYIGGLLSILVLIALLGYRIVEVRRKKQTHQRNIAVEPVELENLNGNHDHRV